MKKILCTILIYSFIIAEGSISGVTFYDYTYDLSEEALNDDGFSINRVYFTYKNNISENIKVIFQTDVGQVGDDHRLTSYLKKAQLDWKSPFGKITLGMQGMNMFNVTEKTWGFRFIEKSPMDKHNFSSSADMGVGYSGKISDISYSALITNGSGYKKQENDKFKKISIQAVYGQKKLVNKNGFNIGTSLSIEPYEVMAVDQYYDYEWHYNEDEGWHNHVTNNAAVPAFSFNKTVMSFFGGYAGNDLRVGGEFDIANRPQADTDDEGDISIEVKSQIIALYASYKLSKKLEGLVYFDMYDPDTEKIEDAETYIIAGINCYAAKGLIIAPNIRITSFEDGSDNETLFKINFLYKF